MGPIRTVGSFCRFASRVAQPIVRHGPRRAFGFVFAHRVTCKISGATGRIRLAPSRASAGNETAGFSPLGLPVLPITSRRCAPQASGAQRPIDNPHYPIRIAVRFHIFPLARAARIAQFLSIQRKRRLRQRLGRKRHHRPRVVVTRDAIRAQMSTRFAAVDDRPFAVGSYPDGDRFHGCAAGAHAITRRDVQVQTPQAMRAMISMPRAVRFRIHRPTTPSAHEVVALVATTTVLTTQWNYLN